MKKSKFKIFKKFFTVMFSLLLIAVLSASIAFFLYLHDLVANAPELDINRLQDPTQMSYVLDRNGKELAKLYGPEKRLVAKYSEFPENLIKAYICTEDRRFFTHPGVDLKGLANAVYGEVTTGDGRGGSTITQQLIKNIYLTSDRSYKRKAQEMFLALKLERTISKEDILAAYLNMIFMGEDNYGVKVAALDYFGKDISELSLKECATLAGMTSSPNYYNPRENYDEISARANYIIRDMYMNEMITLEECNAAINEELVIADEYFTEEVYPYAAFIDYVVDEIARDFLEANNEKITEDTLRQAKYRVKTGGYKIYTTINTEMQDKLQEIAKNFAYRTEGVEMSAVILDHHTGEIICMIPGREENSVKDGFNRATDALQPIGSSAKPVFVYAPYLELGANTDTIVDDTISKIQGYNTDQGYPNGDTTNEKITLRYAVQSSRNVAATKTLAYQVGVDRAYEFQKKEGINPSHSSQSLNGIALGSDGVTTLEMAGAYATLANDGVYITPHGYTKVTDLNDKTVMLVENHVRKERVFKSETAFMITDILQSTVTNGLATQSQIPGVITGGKTGTHENTSVTFGGFSHYYTCFNRICADDYTPIRETSSRDASRLFKALMTPLHEGLERRAIQEKTLQDLDLVKIGSEYRWKYDANGNEIRYYIPPPEDAEEGAEEGE